MVELFKLHKLVNDYILVQDIDLVRTLVIVVLADIENVTGGFHSFTQIELSASIDNFKISSATSKLISVFLNGFKLKCIDFADLQSLKISVLNWQDNPRYYVYSLLSNGNIHFISGISQENLSKCNFVLETMTKYPRFSTSSISIPDFYSDIILKGILAKLMLHPKYLNPELANQYQSVYQNALQNNFNGV